MKKEILLLTFFLTFLVGCNKNEDPDPRTVGNVDLTIFFVNDQHGQISNFDKVKEIVDDAKSKGNALLVSAGDIFAGNPIVDQYQEKGFPMIDVMNRAGFDVGVLGNHEFDYGTEVLKKRIDQSQFPWVLANVDASSSVLSQPDPYVTLEVGDLKITFLGLVETNGKENDIIPSTHPLRVSELTFKRHEDIVGNYADLKIQEEADVFIALTHLGARSDRELATDHPYFDVIIGGHSHEIINENVNGIPIVQAGSYLNTIGKMELSIADKKIVNYEVSMINLNSVEVYDPDLDLLIDDYNDDPSFFKVIGQSEFNHQSADVGCFYTTALMEYMEVDFTIQNLGGIRAGLNEGDITSFEIFSMDPFNNQGVVFTKTVSEFEQFFCETGAPFFFSGISIIDDGNELQIVDEDGIPLPDDMTMTLGSTDYLPAVYDDHFDFQEADLKEYTTAEAIIGYLENINSIVNFEGCSRIVRCN